MTLKDVTAKFHLTNAMITVVNNSYYYTGFANQPTVKVKAGNTIVKINDESKHLTSSNYIGLDGKIISRRLPRQT